MTSKALKQNIFLTIIISISAMIQISLVFNINISGDEAYSMLLMRLNWRDFITEIMQDTAPPLYYLLLYAFTRVSNSLMMAKMVSIIPVIVLDIYVTVLWQKRNQEHLWKEVIFNAAYVLTASCTYLFLWMGQEIRMYSLATLFVTLTGIYAFLFYEKPVFRNGLLMCVFAVLGMLTNYCVIFIDIYIYFFLLIVMLRERGGRKKIIKKWFLVASGTIALYSWWLPFAYRQAMLPNRTSWYHASFSAFPHYITYLLSSGKLLDIIILAVLLSTIIASFRRIARGDCDSIKLKWGLGFVFLPFIVILTEVGFSVCVFNLFTERYISPAMGLFWLGVVALLKDMLRDHGMVIRMSLSLLLVITLIQNYHSRFVKEYDKGAENMLRSLSEIQSTDLIVTDIRILAWSILPYYYPDNDVIYVSSGRDTLFEGGGNTFWKIDYNNYYTEYDLTGISEGRTVWYFALNNQYEDFIPELFVRQSGSLEKVYSGECEQEYTFDVYKVVSGPQSFER